MSRLKCFFIFTLALIQTGCSGWNSELDTINIASNKELEKPLCDFSPSNNCYTQDIKKIMKCVPDASQTGEKFLVGDRTCTDGYGKNVDFVVPFPEELLPKQVVAFSVSDFDRPCFSFVGNSDNFEVRNAFNETLEVALLENGDTLVSCFSGESFVIKKLVKERGCRHVKAKTLDFLPGASLSRSNQPELMELGMVESFSFIFAGSGQVRPIFNCQR